MSRENENENGYTMETSSPIGEVKIADDVVATIAGLATTEVEGVASMQGNLTNEIVGKLGVRNLSRGVKIELMRGKVHAELSVVMRYGYNIPKTCHAIQERVKTAVENMTGLDVENINIRIVGVETEKTK